jgi:glucokinase
MTSHLAIGVDVGGTKCAAGLVRFPQGDVLARRLQPTSASRGGRAVLADVVDLVNELIAEASALSVAPVAVGVGVAELVGREGQVLSDATIAWSNVPVVETLSQATGLPVFLDADVRSAARAEASLGAGRGRHSMLYVTVGTGISSSHIVGGVPYAGARGLTGTCGSAPGLIPTSSGQLASGPPLEQFASGPAIANRFSSIRGERLYATHEVIDLAEASDELARTVVTSAGAALGAMMAHLVNVLDPEVVVLGGGLGLVGGAYRRAIDDAFRAHIWSDLHRSLPLLSAQLGVDAGVVGAALFAADECGQQNAQEALPH